MNAIPAKQQSPSIPALPLRICFRVTRFCNARCGFCLAPPDGGRHPEAQLLRNRIHWLLSHGVKTIHFCGGEPSIHHNLPELINYVHSLGGKSKMTTNGITISGELIAALKKCKTEVKISLHGSKEHHNTMVGCDAFDKTTTTIKKLLKEGINTSVQTTIVGRHLDMVDWVIQFCTSNGVKKVSFLPFIPRGSGYAKRSEYGLLAGERKTLRAMVTQKRREHSGRPDIRLLDFTARPIHVVEPDGKIILECATESMDKFLFQIP